MECARAAWRCLALPDATSPAAGAQYADMLSVIQEAFPALARDSDGANDTAKHWQLPGAAGRVGFITSMSEHFCGTCNRLRITADGNIKVRPLGFFAASALQLDSGFCRCASSTTTKCLFATRCAPCVHSAWMPLRTFAESTCVHRRGCRRRSCTQSLRRQ